MDHHNVDRRDFLKTSAAGAAAASALSLSARSYGQVPGANERIGIAFLGVGGRCQDHIDVILALQRANRNSVAPTSVVCTTASRQSDSSYTAR